MQDDFNNSSKLVPIDKVLLEKVGNALLANKSENDIVDIIAAHDFKPAHAYFLVANDLLMVGFDTAFKKMFDKCPDADKRDFLDMTFCYIPHGLSAANMENAMPALRQGVYRCLDLMLANGCDINQESGGILMGVACDNDIASIDELVRRGADVGIAIKGTKDFLTWLSQDPQMPKDLSLADTAPGQALVILENYAAQKARTLQHKPKP